MQKKLIAAAIAGLFAVPVMAQSNVTISGQMRVGVDHVSAGGATAVGVSPISRMRVIDNNSNIRFAGTETLGGGLTAWWQVESAIGTSDNVGTSGAQTPGLATSTGIGTRNTAVGIKGAWGNIYVGKWDMHYSTGAGVDSSGLAGGLAMGASHLNLLHNQGNGAAGSYQSISGAGGRLNNAIMYDTPTWNGFNVRLGYSTSAANEILTNAAGAGGEARRESNWWLNPQYNNGPWSAFYSYFARNNIGNTAKGAPGVFTAAPDAHFHRAGLAYTFGMGLKLGVLWDRNTVEIDTLATTPSNKRTAWAIPVQYAMGPHTFNFTYARAGDSSNTAAVDTGAKMYMLGYTYALSKRTMLGANWTKINNAAGGTYDLWHPSSGIGAQSGGVIPAGADPRQFGVNLHHSF